MILHENYINVDQIFTKCFKMKSCTYCFTQSQAEIHNTGKRVISYSKEIVENYRNN